MNTLAAVYQVVSSLIIIIVLLASPEERAEGRYVFSEFNNDTGLKGHDGFVIFLASYPSHSFPLLLALETMVIEN